MSVNYEHPFYSVNEIAEKFGVTPDTACSYLKALKVEVVKPCKTRQVFKLEFDIAIGKAEAKRLRNCYPKSWDEMYLKTAKDKSVAEVVIDEIKSECLSLPVKPTIVKTDSGKKLLTKLNNL